MAKTQATIFPRPDESLSKEDSIKETTVQILEWLAEKADKMGDKENAARLRKEITDNISPATKEQGGGSGNIEGLAKHLSHKYSDPGLFSQCMDDPLLDGYPDDVKKAICARVHELITGMWPGEHGGKNPNGTG
jgi:hypothetical protein